MILKRCLVPTPLGEIILLHDGDALVALLWGDGVDRGLATFADIFRPGPRTLSRPSLVALTR